MCPGAAREWALVGDGAERRALRETPPADNEFESTVYKPQVLDLDAPGRGDGSGKLASERERGLGGDDTVREALRAAARAGTLWATAAR